MIEREYADETISLGRVARSIATSPRQLQRVADPRGGGSAPEAERAVGLFGLPREVEPATAVLEEVHRAAGHVAWLAEVVGQLDKSQIVHGITRPVQGRPTAPER